MLGLVLDKQKRKEHNGTKSSPGSVLAAERESGNVELSVVVPVFNEEENIPFLIKKLTAAVSAITDRYELVIVNDGSTDKSVEALRQFANLDSHIKIISFSRNFGHQIAITAGMELSKGDAVVVIDADLQDPPELIRDMVQRWREGFDVVYAIRKQRKGETFLKLATAKIFYRLLAFVANVKIPMDAGDFRLLSRRAVISILSMPEQRRYIRGMVSWLGFPQTGIYYERQERKFGQTHYPFRKMLHFALDGITSFSYFPLHLASYLGFFCSAISLLMILYALWVYLFNDQVIHGWAASITVTLFIGGVQLLMIGILGEYIGRVLNEMKRRPLYIVQETVNMDR